MHGETVKFSNTVLKASRPKHRKWQLYSNENGKAVP